MSNIYNHYTKLQNLSSDFRSLASLAKRINEVQKQLEQNPISSDKVTDDELRRLHTGRLPNLLREEISNINSESIDPFSHLNDINEALDSLRASIANSGVMDETKKLLDRMEGLEIKKDIGNLSFEFPKNMPSEDDLTLLDARVQGYFDKTFPYRRLQLKSNFQKFSLLEKYFKRKLYAETDNGPKIRDKAAQALARLLNGLDQNTRDKFLRHLPAVAAFKVDHQLNQYMYFLNADPHDPNFREKHKDDLRSIYEGRAQLKIERGINTRSSEDKYMTSDIANAFITQQTIFLQRCCQDLIKEYLYYKDLEQIADGNIDLAKLKAIASNQIARKNIFENLNVENLLVSGDIAKLREDLKIEEAQGHFMSEEFDALNKFLRKI